MKELIVDVGFSTYDWGNVEKIKVEFSAEDLAKIKKHQDYVEANADVFKVVMYWDADYLDSDGKEDTEYRHEGAELYIFPHAIYVYSQSKHDSSIQIESEAIDNELLFNQNK